MDITSTIEQGKRDQLPIEQLRQLAGNRAAFGDDVVEVFSAQAERRAVAAGAVLKTAEDEQRDLLASEQRGYDRTMREAEQIRSLQRDVEMRTAQRGFVPQTQTRTSETSTPERVAAVLTGEQRCCDWLKTRGGFIYQDETGVEAMRFGAIVRALAVGSRSHLSDLERRALSEGSDGAGGFTVPEVLATQFIDRVRNAMTVQRAGAMLVPMTSDTLHIARLAQPGVHVGSPITNAAIGGWKTENLPIDDSDLTLERVTFTARTLPLLIKMSVELSEDSVNIDEVIERELAQATAVEVDRVALVGSGTPPEPRGILNQSGVSVVALNATPTDYDFVIDAIGRVWAENHDPNARIVSNTLAVAMAKFKSTADAQPLRVPDVVAAIPQFRTNQIPSLGSPDGTSLFVGDFRQLMIGMRTSFRIEVSRVAGDAFQNLQVWVRSYIRADVQLAHPEAFDVTTDIGT